MSENTPRAKPSKRTRTVRIVTEDEPTLQEAPEESRSVRISTLQEAPEESRSRRISTLQEETEESRSRRFSTDASSLTETFTQPERKDWKQASKKKSFFQRVKAKTKLLASGTATQFWAFEIDAEKAHVDLCTTIDDESPDFFFTRSGSARRSLAINLGVHRATLKTSENHDRHFIDVYWKANTTTCMRNLLAISFGRGILDLPAAMALCGILPGFLTLCVLGALNLFFMHRTIEAPQVLKRSMAFYEDIAKEILGPTGFRILVFGNLLALFGQMVKMFETELTSFGRQLKRFNVGTFDIGRVGKFEMLGLAPMVVLIMAPFALRTSAKALHTNSTIAVYTQRVIVATLCACSIVRVVEDWGEHKYVPINYDIFNQLRGFSMFLHAFFGPMLVPTILSDMLHPGEAKRVCNLVMREVMIMFISVATLGYFGCAKLADNLPSYDFFKVLGTEGRDGDVGGVLVTAVRLLFTFKNITTFPLFFSPWRRLIESFLHLETDPAIAINLPWAVRRLQWRKRILRLGLLLLVPLVYMTMRFASTPQAAFQIFYALVLLFPITISMLFFPAWFTATLWTRSFEDNDLRFEEDPFFYSMSFAFENDAKSARSSQHASTFTSQSRHFNSMSSSRKSVATPGKSFASSARKSYASSTRKRAMTRLDIDLPPSMLKEKAQHSWIKRTHDEVVRRCSCFCELSEEMSLLTPAWSKTLTGNFLIAVCCCLAVGFWAAAVVDVIDEIFFTDPKDRKIFSG